MNIAKKISASPNCRYGDPPVTVNKKVPSNAIAPTTAHTAVTTLEVKLSNMRALPFVWFVRRSSNSSLRVTRKRMRARLSLERRTPPCWSLADFGGSYSHAKPTES
jgi:hypothetical protein